MGDEVDVRIQHKQARFTLRPKLYGFSLTKIEYNEKHGMR